MMTSRSTGEGGGARAFVDTLQTYASFGSFISFKYLHINIAFNSLLIKNFIYILLSARVKRESTSDHSFCTIHEL